MPSEIAPIFRYRCLRLSGARYSNVTMFVSLAKSAVLSTPLSVDARSTGVVPVLGAMSWSLSSAQGRVCVSCAARATRRCVVPTVGHSRAPDLVVLKHRITGIYDQARFFAPVPLNVWKNAR